MKTTDINFTDGTPVETDDNGILTALNDLEKRVIEHQARYEEHARQGRLLFARIDDIAKRWKEAQEFEPLPTRDGYYRVDNGPEIKFDKNV